MPRRPYHEFVNRYGCSTNEQMLSVESDQDSHFLVCLRLWATNLVGGMRSGMRSDLGESVGHSSRPDRAPRQRLMWYRISH